MASFSYSFILLNTFSYFLSNFLRPCPTFSNLPPPSSTFFNLLRPSPTLSDLLRPSPTFSGLLRPSPTSSDLLRHSRTFSDLLRPSPTFSDPLPPSPTFSHFLFPGTFRERTLGGSGNPGTVRNSGSSVKMCEQVRKCVKMLENIIWTNMKIEDFL